MGKISDMMKSIFRTKENCFHDWCYIRHVMLHEAIREFPQSESYEVSKAWFRIYDYGVASTRVCMKCGKVIDEASNFKKTIEDHLESQKVRKEKAIQIWEESRK